MMLFKWRRHESPRVEGCPGERPIRSLAKAVSWRVTGSLDTILLSWLFTGDMAIAAAIGFTEVLTKTVLYYLHERAWNRISLGRKADKGAMVIVPVFADQTRIVKQRA